MPDLATLPPSKGIKGSTEGLRRTHSYPMGECMSLDTLIGVECDYIILSIIVMLKIYTFVCNFLGYRIYNYIYLATCL